MSRYEVWLKKAPDIGENEEEHHRVVHAVGRLLKKDNAQARKILETQLPLKVAGSLSERQADRMFKLFRKLLADVYLVEMNPPAQDGAQGKGNYEDSPAEMHSKTLSRGVIILLTSIFLSILAVVGYQVYLRMQPLDNQAERALKKGDFQTADSLAKQSILESGLTPDRAIQRVVALMASARAHLDSTGWSDYGLEGGGVPDQGSDLLRLPQVDTALQVIKEARRRFPDEKELMRWEAYVLHQKGRLEEAERVLDELIEQAPNNSIYLNMAALVAKDKGLYSKADNLLRKALDKDRENPAIMKNLGELNLNYIKDSTAAMRWLRLYLKYAKASDADRFPYRLEVARLAWQKGGGNYYTKRPQEVLSFEVFEQRKAQLLKRQDRMREDRFHLEMGRLIAARGMLEISQQEFFKSIQAGGADGDARVEMARVLISRGNPQGAWIHLNKASKEDSKNVSGYRLLGMLEKYYRQDDDAAEDAFKKYMALGGDIHAGMIQREYEGL